MSQKVGFAAEDVAKQFLMQKGLELLHKNYRARCGEIDLIMQDGTDLVFIEVRSRACRRFGGAAETVNFHKQQKIIKTAQSYLIYHKLYDKKPIRFDVVTLEGSPPEVVWIKNAFGG